MKLALRITFTLLFFTVLFSTALSTTKRRDKISRQECMRDYTFLMTSKVNEFLQGHNSVTNGFIIYSSMLMDFLILSYIMLFFLYWKTYRVILTYIMFFGFRIVVQVSIIKMLILYRKLSLCRGWTASCLDILAYRL